ncbi:MAG: hypothetical protein HC902_07935 [Calothrix sp. SM1_5_4]|nr:hypothetical protein [Calothrix sp. SM1_5_4]
MDLLRRAARRLSLEELDEETLVSLRERARWEPKTGGETRPFPTPKHDDTFALTRVYRGPDFRNVDETTAFAALNSLLSLKISNHNRSDQSLGYAHGSVVRTVGGGTQFMILMGQTDGVERARRTLEGWDHTLEQLRNGEITDDDIRDAIAGLLNELTERMTTAAELVSLYSGFQNLRLDARALSGVIAALKRMTPEDVRSIARKYLLAAECPS